MMLNSGSASAATAAANMYPWYARDSAMTQLGQFCSAANIKTENGYGAAAAAQAAQAAAENCAMLLDYTAHNKVRAHLDYLTQTCDIGHMTICSIFKMG